MRLKKNKGRSLRFSVWFYFLVFAAIMMLLIWMLQILFLNTSFQTMKINSAEKYVADLTYSYEQGSLEGLYKYVETTRGNNDIYVQIETDKEVPVFRSSEAVVAYKPELETLKGKLSEQTGKDNSVTMILTTQNTQRQSWGYCGYLDENKMLKMLIITPLYPVGSTIEILREQFVYIAIIATILAMILSFFLSSRISRPISALNQAAKKMAAKNYDVNFNIKTSYREIRDLADSLNTASVELNKAETLQKDLIANVSHDLKTPLTMVKSYAEMIRDLSGDNAKKRTEHLQVIIDESDRLNALVNDLLILSSAQAGTLSFEFTTFNLKDTFQSIINTYELLEDEGYKIHFNCRNDVYVRADEARIKQIIANLLSNSVKYSGEDKSVYVNVKKWNTKVHCEFVDHGVGISPDELPFVWERYYKSSSNHVRKAKGSGIGLSIVKEILLAHDAKFGVESKVGKGTTFWFELDLVEPPEDFSDADDATNEEDESWIKTGKVTRNFRKHWLE